LAGVLENKTEASRFGFFYWVSRNPRQPHQPHHPIAICKYGFRQSALKSGFDYGFCLQKLNLSGICIDAQFLSVL
jgi:hypothetical protein